MGEYVYMHIYKHIYLDFRRWQKRGDFSRQKSQQHCTVESFPMRSDEQANYFSSATCLLITITWEVCCYCFNYSLQSTLFYQFQVQSKVVRESYTLQSGPPNISSTHLAPHIVVTKLLTIFPTSSSSLSGPMHRQKFSEYLLCA